MRITFWSPIHGQAAVTSNMLVVAFLSGILHKKKSIITQTQFNNNNLEGPLVGSNLKNRSAEDYFRGTGLDTLIRSFKAAHVTLNDVENCCISFQNTNVSLLPGTTKINRAHFNDEINKAILGLLNQIDDLYDITFLDVNSGENPVSMEIVKKSDLVVVNLPQNIHVSDDFFENQQKKLETGGEFFYLFGNYDCDSRYNINMLRKRYKKYVNKENSGAIPHNALYLDAQNSGSVSEFIKLNINCKKSDVNYYFIEKSCSATNKIIKKINAIKIKKDKERIS
jgi:hypothetical protein